MDLPRDSPQLQEETSDKIDTTVPPGESQKLYKLSVDFMGGMAQQLVKLQEVSMYTTLSLE